MHSNSHHPHPAPPLAPLLAVRRLQIADAAHTVLVELARPTGEFPGGDSQ
ncbi:hypothetical protein [Streptomyces clavuligerus]|nr:hypothetical protein [Streptomyces clavuligerus]WDN56201.1 hypothetical protein LL058_30585 [Streptomyces clavuligerus]